MDIFIGVAIFIWFWLSVAFITILAYNAFKFLYVNRDVGVNTNRYYNPDKEYEPDQRQPNFD